MVANDMRQSVGILAYGALREDPGQEILSATAQTLTAGVMTPFTVEFARSSTTRAGAPMLVPFEQGGAHVPAQIFVLQADVSEKEAKSLLWRRETDTVGSGREYTTPGTPGPDTLRVESLENFQGIDRVLFAQIAPNIAPLTAEKLAELALHSARLQRDGRDGISYLLAAQRQSITTPLSTLYAEEIKRQARADNLQQARDKMQYDAARGVGVPGTSSKLDSFAGEEGAGADGEPQQREVSSHASLQVPESYQKQFFVMLHDMVSGAVEIRQQSSLLGDRSDPMARLLTLSRRLDETGNAEALYRQAYFAAALWKANPSIVSTVSAVLDDIEFASSRNSPIYTVMRGLVMSLICLLFGGLTLLIVSSFVYAWSSGMVWQKVISGPYFSLLTAPIIVASTFGMLGAVVSVLLRLSEFENATRRSRQFLQMTGVMLPLVGTVFACVTCALFASGIINFNFATGSDPKLLIDNTYFFIVVGFLSGFSERFTRGLLGTAEHALITTRREEARAVSVDGVLLGATAHSTDVITQNQPHPPLTP